MTFEEWADEQRWQNGALSRYNAELGWDAGSAAERARIVALLREWANHPNVPPEVNRAPGSPLYEEKRALLTAADRIEGEG